MKYPKLLPVLLVLFISGRAQDSARVFNHELGFNAVSLLRQVVVFNTSDSAQLPFDVFYNIYYKDKIGLRVGAGIFSSYSESSVPNQQYPLIFSSSNMNWRFGGSYNFSTFGKRVTLNCFADFVYQSRTSTSVQSFTTHTFPNPLVTDYTSNETRLRGTGFQLGMGIKCQIYKQMHIYVEVPYSFMFYRSETDLVHSSTGVEDEIEHSDSKSFSNRIILPATFYLVVKF